MIATRAPFYDMHVDSVQLCVLFSYPQVDARVSIEQSFSALANSNDDRAGFAFWFIAIVPSFQLGKFICRQPFSMGADLMSLDVHVVALFPPWRFDVLCQKSFEDVEERSITPLGMEVVPKLLKALIENEIVAGRHAGA